MFFSCLYVINLVKPTQRGFEEVVLIRFFCKDKQFVDIRAVDNTTTRQWGEQCDLFWKLAYRQSVILQKQHDCEKLLPYITNFHTLCIERYYFVARSMWRSKVAGERIRQGRLNLIKGDRVNENIFLILYPYFISIQDDEKRKQVGFVILKLAFLVDETGTTNFSIHTPRDQFVFQATHETAKLEWIKPITKYMLLSGNKTVSKEAIVEEETILKQNIYTKPLVGRLSLAVDSPYGKSVIKLKSSGPWKIGRSRDNEICLNDQYNFLSRAHCEIQLIDNFPYLKDLGSAGGTFINSIKITKSPLKSGDIIKVGSIKLTFQVKAFLKKGKI